MTADCAIRLAYDRNTIASEGIAEIAIDKVLACAVVECVNVIVLIRTVAVDH